jgi:hypothetical protein
MGRSKGSYLGAHTVIVIRRGEADLARAAEHARCRKLREQKRFDEERSVQADEIRQKIERADMQMKRPWHGRKKKDQKNPVLWRKRHKLAGAQFCCASGHGVRGGSHE